MNIKERISIASGRFQDIDQGSDKIRKKRKLKKLFSEDPAIIEVINNAALDPRCPDEYLDVNILSWLKLNYTQDEKKNFICFDIDDIEPVYGNDAMKTQILTVMCMVNEMNMKTNWDMDRTDALSYLVIDNLNNSNYLGFQCKLISDKVDIIDTRYYCRILKFQMYEPNGMGNLRNGKYDKFTI